jgi:hypothetical protein
MGDLIEHRGDTCTCETDEPRTRTNTFEVAPAAGGGWGAWAAASRRLVERLATGPTHCVVITPDPNQRYVQFLIGHGRIRLEMSSNHYLLGDFRLSGAEERYLAGLGFSLDDQDEHDDEHDDDDPRFPQNWHVTEPVDPARTSAIVVHLLEEVAGFDPRWPITVAQFGADRPCPACTWPDG